jgi:hypothetical protein
MYSEEGKSTVQEIKDTVTDFIEPISDSVEYVQEHMPDTRFKKIVNQYRKWIDKRKNLKTNKES